MGKVTSRAMLEAFRSSGHRMTDQRKKVFEYLESNGEEHPSARQIFAGLSVEDSMISVATVYNTLSSLVRMGLVKVLEYDSSENRYEVNLEPHVNLVCRGCGQIRDCGKVAVAKPETLEENGSFTVSDQRIEYYGLCNTCTSDSAPE